MVARNEHALRSCCPLACGLDVIGDHWTLLIVRDMLLMGKHEFREFLESDEGIASNILTDRLNRLQEHGLIEAIPHPENRRRKLYYLTPPGKDLIHVLMSLVQWTYKHYQDAVEIPPARRKAMGQGPEEFVRQTLASLAEWEALYGVAEA